MEEFPPSIVGDAAPGFAWAAEVTVDGAAVAEEPAAGTGVTAGLDAGEEDGVERPLAQDTNSKRPRPTTRVMIPIGLCIHRVAAPGNC